MLHKRLNMLPFLLRASKTQLSTLLHAGWRTRPPFPRAMCLYVTYRCNLRCRICGIWRGESQEQNEFSRGELDRILSDSLFARLEFVNLNGGEPNLRADLPDIASLLLEKLPRLRTLTLNSNGIPAETTIRNVEKITDLARAKRTRFSISLSLHAVGEAHDGVVGVAGTYARISETFEELKKLRRKKDFYLSANCVVSNLNLYDLEAMREWGRRHDVPVNFTLGEIRERFLNQEMASDVLIDDKGREELIRFFRRLGQDKKTYLQHALRYDHLADMLASGKARALSCHYYLGGLILGADGTLSYCKWSPSIGNCQEDNAQELYFSAVNLKLREEELRRSKCPICPPNTFNEIEAEHDVFKLFAFLLRPGSGGYKDHV
jgi:MoaA/NifB/PqqE/SkfB family radical SAM enzyme